MGDRQDTYKYQVRVGKKVVHMGITTDLERRVREHKREFPKGKIVQVGRMTTRDLAMRWEREKLNKYKIEPKELRSLSQNTRSKLLKHRDRIYKILDKRG